MSAKKKTSVSIPPRKSRNLKSEIEIEQGLMAIALESGNSRRAERRLADMGVKIAQSTLHKWMTRHDERYEQIRREVLPQLRAHAAEKHTAYADAEMEVGLQLLERLQGSLDDIPARDISTALRNIDVGQGIHRTKAAELRGELQDQRPRVEINIHETVRQGEAGGWLKVIEGGKAEEVSGDEVKKLSTAKDFEEVLGPEEKDGEP